MRRYQMHLIVFLPLITFWALVFVAYKVSKIRVLGNLIEAFQAGWVVFWN